MENKTFALKGNIVYTKDKNELCINEQSYLVCENGKVRGIYKELPDELKNVPVEDMGDQLILRDLQIFIFMPRSIPSGVWEWIWSFLTGWRPIRFQRKRNTKIWNMRKKHTASLQSR